MAFFEYSGIDLGTKKAVQGRIAANSVQHAQVLLRQKRVGNAKITKANQAKSGSSSKQSVNLKAVWEFLNKKPIKLQDQAWATKQLATLINAAVPIDQALKALMTQMDSIPQLRVIYEGVLVQVESGKSLSQAHGKYPQVFDTVYINLLAAGEKSGTLPYVMNQLAALYLYRFETKKKITNAIAYPLMLVVAAIAVGVYLLTSVLPSIMDSFKSLSVELPWYTNAVNSLSVFLQNWWLTIALFLTGIGILISSWAKTKNGQRKLDSFMLKAPVISPVVSGLAYTNFTKTMFTVLSGGLRLLEALQVSRNVIGNSLLRDAMDEVIERIQKGEKLSTAFEKSKDLPVLFVAIAKTGEKSGQLTNMLQSLADSLDSDTKDKIDKLTLVLQPMATVLIAMVILMMVIAIIGPIGAAMQQVS
jgi:general secretion pathway protein F